jgi:hypothetical protein
MSKTEQIALAPVHSPPGAVGESMPIEIYFQIHQSTPFFFYKRKKEHATATLNDDAAESTPPASHLNRPLATPLCSSMLI